MLLAIDIGNTSINLGLFSGSRLVKKSSIRTDQKRYYLYLRKIISSGNIERIVICSVVPNALVALKKDIRKLFNNRPYIVGQDILVPIKNLYRDPSLVGQDRLVNAYGAVTIYGYPAIVVDFGTAITFDIISQDREYIGGLIIPGLRMSLEALFRKTALLPRISLSRPRELVGRDTKNSILSGVVGGSTILVDSLIKQIKKELGSSGVKVIGTGGDLKIIKPLLKQIKIIDENLTLRTLAFLGCKNNINN